MTRLSREEVIKAARSLDYKMLSDVDRGESYQISGEPMDEELKQWCYAFPDESGTHYGPVKAESVPKLLELIGRYFKRERLEAGVEFWLTDEKSYIYPPKAGSGVTIYAFDSKAGWRPLRQA
jgi:hypothetical protein